MRSKRAAGLGFRFSVACLSTSLYSIRSCHPAFFLFLLLTTLSLFLGVVCFYLFSFLAERDYCITYVLHTNRSVIATEQTGMHGPEGFGRNLGGPEHDWNAVVKSVHICVSFLRRPPRLLFALPPSPFFPRWLFVPPQWHLLHTRHLVHVSCMYLNV